MITPSDAEEEPPVPPALRAGGDPPESGLLNRRSGPRWRPWHRQRQIGSVRGAAGGAHAVPASATSSWSRPSSALAILLAAAALAVDQAVAWGDPPMPIFAGEPDTARALLSIIGGAVATLLALIFTVIAMVIQLAIGQYTLRSLQILLGDRPTHFTIGVFVGTFTYALVVILGLRVATEGDRVVGLSPTLAFGLAIVTIATFAVYSNHIIHSVRATSIIHRLADQTRLAVETLHPPLRPGEHGDAPPPLPPGRPVQIVAAPKPGVLVDLDERALCPRIEEWRATLRLLQPIGAFVPEGAPLVAIHGAAIDQSLLHRAVRLEPERTMALDASYGLRQLLDIAARALSPGVNDRRRPSRYSTSSATCSAASPTAGLPTQAGRATRPPAHRRDGRRLGDPDPAHARRDAPPRQGLDTVLRRLRAVLADLLEVAPAGCRACLEEQIALLDQAAADFATERERHWARIADPRGAGK